MADRYDEYERRSRGQRGNRQDESRDRGNAGRQQSEPYNQRRGNWPYPESHRRGDEPYGEDYAGERGDYGYANERRDYGYAGERRDYGYGQRGNYGGDFGHSSDYGRRQDYGVFGAGERNEYQNDQQEQRFDRDWSPRGGEWYRSPVNRSSDRSGHDGPFGTGSQGFGTGYRSGENSSERINYGNYGGSGSYTGFGGSNSGSYSGGAGSSGQMRGRFSGKGPKGYQRSDDRIREDVCERLTHHPEVDASEIDVKVNNGEVTLTGTVDERNAKRMAEDAVENVSGVREIHNQLRVKEHEMAGPSSSSGGSSTSGAGKEQGSQKRSV